jgi:DNA-directed RNA polymerase subunit RPC12/RpoP
MWRWCAGRRSAFEFMNTTEHLLTCLAEECAEVAKDAAKSLRFGLEERNVLNPTGPTNRERLLDELNDLLAVVELMVERGILPADWGDPAKRAAKRGKVLRFMSYAASVGALDRANYLAWSAVDWHAEKVEGDGKLQMADRIDEPAALLPCAHCGGTPQINVEEKRCFCPTCSLEVLSPSGDARRLWNQTQMYLRPKTELLPCAHCGARAERGDVGFLVRCTACDHAVTGPKAVADWNDWQRQIAAELGRRPAADQPSTINHQLCTARCLTGGH